MIIVWKSRYFVKHTY